MLRRVLAVELEGRFLHAVRVRQGWRKVRLDGVLSIECPSADEDGEGWERTREELRRWSASFGRPGRVVANLGATEAFPSRLRLPFRRLSQIGKVVKAEMESEVPLSPEEMVVDFVPIAPGGEEGLDVFVVAAPKAAIARCLERLARLDVSPGRIGFSPLAGLRAALALTPGLAGGEAGVVHVGETHVAFTLVRGGRPAFMRVLRREADETEVGWVESLARDLALTLRGWAAREQGEAAPSRLVLTGLAPLEPVSSRLEEALGIPTAAVSWSRALAARRVPPPDILGRISPVLGSALPPASPLDRRFDLRREEFAPREGWRELRRPLVAACLAALLAAAAGAGDLMVKVRKEEKRLRASEQVVRRVIREAIPGEGRVASPGRRLFARVEEQVRRLEVLAGKSQEGLGPVAVLAKISRAIPASVRVRLNRLSIDGKGLSLDGETASFEAVEKIKSGLAGEGGLGGVELRRAQMVEGRRVIRFQLRARLSGGAGGRGR